uniref:DUF632 domain-containing protein n=1 Tax=Aegilops tauschii subsp. strangulata TaxID=200361 RepID=A0A453B0G1_AEGTS
PDLPLPPAIKKKPSGEAPIMEEEDEGEDARPPEPEDDGQLQPPPPPPPPPTQLPAPTRPPPSLPPDTRRKGDSWSEIIFGSPDGITVPPPTLAPSAAAAASWAAERAEAPAPPPPPPEPEEQPLRPPPAPPAAAEDVAKGKKPMVEAGARRAVTQKAARRPEGKKGRTVVMAAPAAARLGDILRDLDDHFLKASDSAHEVSKMLEAARMHYHSNFAETRGTHPHLIHLVRPRIHSTIRASRKYQPVYFLSLSLADSLQTFNFGNINFSA